MWRSVTCVQEVLVKALTTQQLQRRFVVQVHIMEWVGENFRHPHQAGLYILDEAQVDGAKQQAAYAQGQPGIAHGL